jgi:hypothetical protein
VEKLYRHSQQGMEALNKLIQKTLIDEHSEVRGFQLR